MPGRFPESFDESQFKDLLGADKYRGYLNYFYGVMVEEALQLAVEAEVHKRHLSNGNQYQRDFMDEAYFGIYGAPMSTLLKLFREAKEYPRPAFDEPLGVYGVYLLAVQIQAEDFGQSEDSQRHTEGR